MENRWGYRTPSELDAIIDYRPMGLVRGTLRNYSLSGIYLQTDTESIPLNQHVSLIFLIPGYRVLQSQRVRALTVRQDDAGLGLMFTVIERHTLRILHALHLNPGKSLEMRRSLLPAVETPSEIHGAARGRLRVV